MGVAVTHEQVSILLERFYGLSAKCTRLGGEYDQNYQVSDTQESKKFLLKIAPVFKDLKSLRFETEVQNIMAQKCQAYHIPKILPSLDGKLIIETMLHDHMVAIRLIEWVDGEVLGNIHLRTVSMLKNWGELAGIMSTKMPEAPAQNAANQDQWNLDHFDQNEELVELIDDPDLQLIISSYFSLFRDRHRASLTQCEKGLIHGDLNDHNVFIDPASIDCPIIGAIDFGDLMYTSLIHELAVTAAYAIMHCEDPLAAVSHMLQSYTHYRQATELELQLLYGLIAMRLCTTICHAAKNKIDHPDREYLQVSNIPARDALLKWHSISPKLAYYSFREASGLSPLPQKKRILEHIRRTRKGNILPYEKLENLSAIHLGIDSHLLDENGSLQSDLAEYKLKKELGEKTGIGGYGEIRSIYDSEQFVSEGLSGRKYRSVHLGLDLWTREGTEVYSPLDGRIYGVADHQVQGDYGGLVIVEHKVGQDNFFLLYGHLDPRSISRQIGDDIKAGEKIAQLGARSVNGGWVPHLHFQLILDMLDHKDNFPGVCAHEDQALWKAICPDPCVFFPIEETEKEEYSVEQLLQLRGQYIGKNLSISYADPLYVLRGRREFLIDHKGHSYLDLVNNVAHVGHENPRIVNVIKRQAEKLNTNTRYLHHLLDSASRRLLETLPDHITRCYFVNSGSEANDLALRMARCFTGSLKTLCLEMAYHGHTQSLIDVSGYKNQRTGGAGFPMHVQVLEVNTSRDHVQNKFRTSNSIGQTFIHESILSCAGQVPLNQEFIQEIYHQVHQNNGVCIADEVQTGLGRVGSHYWAFQLYDLNPDIVTIGKPIGNGHPIAVVACSEKVAEAFDNGMEYFNTFGGNPVSCAVVKEMLSIIEEDGLLEKAKEKGHFLKKAVETLSHKYTIINDVRGEGLFLGVQMGDGKYHSAKNLAKHLKEELRQQGILVSTDGPNEDILKIKPPLVITVAELDYFVRTLRNILARPYFSVH